MFEVVTTFHQEKHNYFSDKMLETYDRFWSKEINLYAYVEKPKNNYNFGNNIKIINFDSISEDFNFFEFNYKNKEMLAPDNSYRYQAVRFAHKIYAIKSHLKNCKANYLIWLDSDIITINNVNTKFLKKFTNKDIYFSYLGRQYLNFHSEAGFMVFNLKNEFHLKFWNEISKMYDNGKLFNEKEWHDSYIFDVVRSKLENENMKCLNIPSLGLVKGKNVYEVLDNSLLGQSLKHLKGNRKGLANNL